MTVSGQVGTIEVYGMHGCWRWRRRSQCGDVVVDDLRRYRTSWSAERAARRFNGGGLPCYVVRLRTPAATRSL